MNNFFWSHTLLAPPPVVELGYARLYNFPAASNALFAPMGWSVPNKAKIDTLIINLGGELLAGGKMKEVGLTHWNNPNTGATNDAMFSAFGGGYRYGGVFYDLKNWGYWLTSSEYSAVSMWIYAIVNANAVLSRGSINKNFGGSIRLIKDDPSTWNPGDTVTDYDGNIYQTVKIGDQVWIASNYKGTKLSDGTPILYVEDNATWILNDGLAKQCVWGNDPGNL